MTVLAHEVLVPGGDISQPADEKKDEEPKFELPEQWSLKANFVSDVIGATKFGAPLMLGSAAKVIQGLFVTVMLGQKSTVLLAAIASSMIWTDPLDDAIKAIGFQLTALCAQAFGAGNFSLVGTWAQMGVVIVAFLSVPIMLVKMATGPILLFLGVPPITAVPAGLFATWTSFGIVFEMWYFCFWAFFIGQGIVGPDIFLGIAFLAITTLVVWVILFQYDMGTGGVAVAYTIKRSLRLVFLVLISWFMGYFKKCWRTPTVSEVFNRTRWQVLVVQLVPAALGASLEKVSYSLNVVIAARGGPTQSAGYELIAQLIMFIFVCEWAFASGFGVLMAQYLGEGKPIRAAGVCKSGCIVIHSVLAALSVLAYACWPAYVRFASTDVQVQAALMEARAICSIGISTSGGVWLYNELLSKQGRVATVMSITPPLVWLLGLPTSFILAPKYGLIGIWTGTTLAYGVAHMILGYAVYKSNWAELSVQARIKAEVGQPVVAADKAEKHNAD